QDLRRLPDTPMTLDPMGIALGIDARHFDKRMTPFREIRRLPPATWLRIGDGTRKEHVYWHLDPEVEVRLPTSRDYADRLRELFVESVRSRIDSPKRIGSALSGGLDSSAICGVAADILKS